MKTSRKTQSVYRNQNALVRAVFERAGDARKVLCVALDYAKRKHLALICNGHGDVLRPFAKNKFRYSECVLQTDRMVSGRSIRSWSAVTILSLRSLLCLVK